MAAEIDPHPFKLITESDYVCKLNPASLEKARKELNEDPKDRMAAVKFFREWIEEQPHLTFTTDTVILLFFLRTAKFSQLKARQMIEESLKLITSPTYKPWFYNVDTYEESTQRVIDSGVFIPLPRPDRQGRQVLLIRPGQLSTSKPQFTVQEEIRANIAMNNYYERDENLQVNGKVFIIDVSGMNLNHLSRMNNSDLKHLQKKLQGHFPGRMKAFHYYNAGAIIEALMAFFKTFMKKKYQERIVLHNTAEDLYKAVGKEILPREYLPDDYKGPCVGTLDEIKAELKKNIMKDDYKEFLLRYTGDAISYDETKKPKETETATFRKLNVD